MASLTETTRLPQVPGGRRTAAEQLVLTIAAHPSLRRVGERAVLPIAGGARVAVSRRTPDFYAIDGRAGGPLADPYISRSLLTLHAGADGAVMLERERDSSALSVNGAVQPGRVLLSPEALRRGVVLELAERAVLLLHRVVDADDPLPNYDLVGESAPLQRVRRGIAESAGMDIPVLIRGETGTGKELVARAVHAASSRAARPYISLNMAAINPQTAIAELFGHTRGSFTGATQARDGYFRDADGGTIFLDEIGEASLAVQGMLLRVLESGEIQPIGGTPGRRVDVRVIAATDADLYTQILQDRFRPALLHRLAGYELAIPPLRDRRDDIGRLLVHFIERELRRAGQPELLHRLALDMTAMVPTALLVRLLMHDWPGNVRQLNNLARRLIAALLAERGPLQISQLLDAEDGGLAAGAAPAPASTDADAIAGHLSDDALRSAMRANDWNIAATARPLDISRTTLYARMQRSGLLRKAGDLPREELAELLRQHGGDLKVMAQHLGVSLRGLQLRLRELALIR